MASVPAPTGTPSLKLFSMASSAVLRESSPAADGAGGTPGADAGVGSNINCSCAGALPKHANANAAAITAARHASLEARPSRPRIMAPEYRMPKPASFLAGRAGDMCRIRVREPIAGGLLA